MNAKRIDQLERSGISPEDIAVRINTIALLGDIQEALSMEVEAMLRKARFTMQSQDLVDIVTIKQAAKRLRKPVDLYLKQEMQIGFGNTADELREVIMKHLTTQKEEV